MFENIRRVFISSVATLGSHSRLISLVGKLSSDYLSAFIKDRQNPVLHRPPVPRPPNRQDQPEGQEYRTDNAHHAKEQQLTADVDQ